AERSVLLQGLPENARHHLLSTSVHSGARVEPRPHLSAQGRRGEPGEPRRGCQDEQVTASTRPAARARQDRSAPPPARGAARPLAVTGAIAASMVTITGLLIL